MIEAGGMDMLFEQTVRLTNYYNWQPTVLSRPAKKVEMNADGAYTSILLCEDDATNPCNAQIGPNLGSHSRKLHNP